MRRLLALVLAVVGLVGCTPDSPEEPLMVPNIAVFLTNDASEPQKKDVEARLRATAGVDTVTFESGDAAYQRFKELFKDEPELIDKVRADQLPESFVIRMKDRAAFDRAKNGSFDADLRLLPGVDDIIFQCGSAEECKRRAESELPSPR